MVIPDRIKQLTEIALKDKVLTFVERETIINEGIKEGIPAEEINEYLNKSLEAKISSMAKEDLDHCPSCGAQIPLISDTCPYCGYEYDKFKHSSGHGNSSRITGDDVNVIANENAKTCPDCGTPFPLISNICPTCGHILHEQTDSDLNIRNLINSMNEYIEGMKLTHKTTFKEVLSFRKEMVMLYVGALVFLMAIVSQFEVSDTVTGIFGLISIVLFVLAFRGLKNRNVEESPVAKEDSQFYLFLSFYEMYTRHVDSLYGKNHEAKEVLAQFGKMIDEVKENKRKNRNKLVLMLVAITLVSIPIPFLLPHHKYEYDTTNLPKEVLTQDPILYEENKAEFAKYYELSSRTTTIKATNEINYPTSRTPYLKAASTANLHADIISRNWLLNDSAITHFKIRLDNVELSSTGRANHSADTLLPFGIVLFTKDYEVITGLPPILLDVYAGDSTDFYNTKGIIENGKGKCRVNFVSYKTTNDFELVKQALDSAYYFMIM